MSNELSKVPYIKSVNLNKYMYSARTFAFLHYVLDSLAIRDDSIFYFVCLWYTLLYGSNKMTRRISYSTDE